MKVNVYESLPEEAIMIRKKVFMEEQGFQNEFDHVDSQAVHLVAFDHGQALGVCRLYYSDSRACFVVGRIAVLKESRGKKLGVLLIQHCEEIVAQEGCNRLELSAQVRVKDFYSKQGFVALDELFDDEGCPHVWMRKAW